MSVLLGLVGRAGSGKDTIAEQLILNHNFVRVAFADKLKEIISDAFDIPLHYFNDRDKKNEPHPNICQRYLMEKFGGIHELSDWFGGVVAELVPEYRDCPDAAGALVIYVFLDEAIIPKNTAISPRQAAQNLGTEGFRQNIKDSIWLDYAIAAAKKQADSGKSVVVTDVRFKNEFEAIVAASGEMIGVFRDSSEKYSHASETSIDELVSRAIVAIDNNESIESLQSKANLLRNGSRLLVHQDFVRKTNQLKDIVFRLADDVGDGLLTGADASFVLDLIAKPGKIPFLSGKQQDWLNRLNNKIANAEPDKKMSGSGNTLKPPRY